MQESRYGHTNITNEYLIYPFKSPIGYNFNYTGTYSKYSIIDKFYADSLVKPVKRLYYGGAEWSEGRMSACTREPGLNGGLLLRAAANPRGMQGYAVGR